MSDSNVISFDKNFIFLDNEAVTTNDGYLDSKGIIFFTEISNGAEIQDSNFAATQTVRLFSFNQ